MSNIGSPDNELDESNHHQGLTYHKFKAQATIAHGEPTPS
jgi:hypothetical protein